MLEVFAGAPDKPFLLELTFDAALPGNALLAHELAASTLVFVQLRPREPQVSLFAALIARVPCDVARAETSRRASQSNRATCVIAQNIIVDAVCGQVSAARVATTSLRVVLALDALFRVASFDPLISIVIVYFFSLSTALFPGPSLF